MYGHCSYEPIRQSLGATMVKEDFMVTMAVVLGFEEWTEISKLRYKR